MSFFSNIFSRGDGADLDDGLELEGGNGADDGGTAGTTTQPVVTTPQTDNASTIDTTGEEGAISPTPTDQGPPFGGDGNIGVQQPTYLADWSGGTTFNDAIKTSEHSIADMMADYNRWAKTNDQDPLDIFTMMNAVQNRDVNKSVQENEKDAKKAARQERWQQAANVLQHLGNFVGTMVGAPSQKIESMTDLTTRQQKIRDAGIAQRAAYNQNLLAQLWKDRADQRAAEKNKADIGLIGQRIQSLQADEERKKAKNEADIALAEARQAQAERQSQLTEERAETERQMRTPKVENMKASTKSHEASAAASRARASASNAAAYGSNYKANRYKIWAENRRKHPNDFRDFMNDNNIHSYDNKNWSAELIDQFNAWIADKHNTQNGGGGGAADLLD